MGIQVDSDVLRVAPFLASPLQSFIKVNKIASKKMGASQAEVLKWPDILEFDQVSSRLLGAESVAPKMPIEDGSYINDHVVTLPQKHELVVVFSDTPIASLIPLAASSRSYEGRAEEKVDILLEIMGKNAPVSLFVGGKLFENRVITRCIPARREGDGRKTTVSLSLEELQIVSSLGQVGTFSSDEDATTHAEYYHTMQAVESYGFLALETAAILL